MQKILVIDDEESLLENIKDFLTAKDFTVFTCQNGDIGLELLKKQNPHLLILDLHLKEGPIGVQILRVAKMLRPDLKIVVLTGFGEEQASRDACISLGADAFLSKPVSLKDLTEVIDKILEEK